MFQKSREQPEGLISVLLNAEAPDADRGDAATDLSDFDAAAAEDALATVAVSNADADLISDCCVSLGEIWCRKGRVNEQTLSALPERGRHDLLTVMRNTCPELAAKAASSCEIKPKVK